MRLSRKLVLISFTLSLIVFQTFNSTEKGDLLISNINVIDVRTGRIDYNIDIVIKGDKIKAIKNHKSKTTYDVTRTVDGTGKFLIPGLWDMHTHTWANYRAFFPLQLANGVTGIREMFGNLDSVQKIKEGIRDGLIDGPMIISSGAILDGNPPTWKSSEVPETPEQGRAFVQKQKQKGADFIKVYFNLKKDVYLAISDESRKLNLPLVGHIPNKVSLEEAIRAGHKSIEHFYNVLEYYSDQSGLDQIEQKRQGRFALDNFYERLSYGNKTFDSSRSKAAIKLLKNKNVWICPTFTVHKGFMRDYDPTYTNDRRMDFMPKNITARWMENKKKPLTEKQIEFWNADKLWYSRILSESKKYKNEGIRFLAGTDSPNYFVYPGFSIHEEMEIFVNEAGFTPLEALQTATINPAIFLDLEETLGTIKEGKMANLVILASNPLTNISNTKSIEGVVLLGKYRSKREMVDIEVR